MPRKLALHALRQHTGLSNPQLAQALGISLRTLEAYGAGVRGMSLDVTQRLATLTGQPQSCPTCGQQVKRGAQER